MGILNAMVRPKDLLELAYFDHAPYFFVVRASKTDVMRRMPVLLSVRLHRLKGMLLIDELPFSKDGDKKIGRMFLSHNLFVGIGLIHNCAWLLNDKQFVIDRITDIKMAVKKSTHLENPWVCHFR